MLCCGVRRGAGEIWCGVAGRGVAWCGVDALEKPPVKGRTRRHKPTKDREKALRASHPKVRFGREASGPEKKGSQERRPSEGRAPLM